MRALRRKGIEKVTKTRDKIVVDRTSQLVSWVDFCREIIKREVCVPDEPAV